MKKTVFVITVLMLSSIFITAGCEEETDTRKIRLIAVENNRLKKQLGQCEAEAAKQKSQIEKLTKEYEALQQQTSDNTKKLLDDILGKVIEENQMLRNENQSLKEQLQKPVEP